MPDHIPMCVFCGAREVQIVVNSAGSGFCSTECEQWANEQEEEKERFDSIMSGRYDAYQSMYDDDPSPYDGTYSEE